VLFRESFAGFGQPAQNAEIVVPGTGRGAQRSVCSFLRIQGDSGNKFSSSMIPQFASKNPSAPLSEFARIANLASLIGAIRGLFISFFR